MAHQTLPYKGPRGLVAHLLLVAIAQMRAPRPSKRHLRILWMKRHREAVLWLGSSNCAEWLGLVGLEIVRVLTELGWREYAKALLVRDVLADEPILTAGERLLLQTGIRRLEPSKQRVA